MEPNNPHLHPSEDVRRYSFSGEDCLYRDHLGRRVVADVEGSGYAVVEVANCLLSAICDDIPAEGFQWSYAGFLTVVALGPGDVSLEVVRGRGAPPERPIPTVALPYAGAGWIVRCPNGVVVDERHESRIVTGPAIPFFRGISGEGVAEIISSSSRCELLDPDNFAIWNGESLKQRGFKVQNLSKLSTLSSTFADGTARTAEIASHLNKASWTLDLPSGCAGLIIRKTYDRFHGRQRARVLIDGEVAGWWYEPAQDRVHRWAVSDFGIDKRFVEGKSQIEIAVDPPPGTPLWSVSEISVFALFES